MNGSKETAAGGPPAADHGPGFVLHEEELELGLEVHQAGLVRGRKRIDTETVSLTESRMVEYGDLERQPADALDSGEIETLEDGSISIPLLEERIVVTKQVFVRERVIVRKQTVTEEQTIETDLRRERLEIEGDI